MEKWLVNSGGVSVRDQVGGHASTQMSMWAGTEGTLSDKAVGRSDDCLLLGVGGGVRWDRAGERSLLWRMEWEQVCFRAS